MRPFQRAILLLAALRELLRYDILDRIAGFNGVLEATRSAPTLSRRAAIEEVDISRAVDTAACIYFKPIRCLQRSVATARLLRRYGLPAELVIGYRPVPFLSHAWVELRGSVVNDSPVYRDRLKVLLRTETRGGGS